MANRMIELTRDPLPDGRVVVRVLFLLPVDPPIQIDGNVVHLKTRADLPPGIEQYGKLFQPELDAIDNGTGTFKVESVMQRKGETIEDVIARAKKRYAKAVREVARERARIAHFGERHNEV